MLRDQPSDAIPMKAVLLRPTRLVAVFFELVLLIALGALSLFTWLDFKRIESIRSHVNRTTLLQESLIVLKDEQVKLASTGGMPDAAVLRKARDALAQVPIKGAPVRAYMRERLDRLDALLTQVQTHPATALPPTL